MGGSSEGAEEGDLQTPNETFRPLTSLGGLGAGIKAALPCQPASSLWESARAKVWMLGVVFVLFYRNLEKKNTGGVIEDVLCYGFFFLFMHLLLPHCIFCSLPGETSSLSSSDFKNSLYWDLTRVLVQVFTGAYAMTYLCCLQ